MNTQTGTETNVLSRSAPWAFLNDKTQPSCCGLGICARVFFTLIFHVPEPQLKQKHLCHIHVLSGGSAHAWRHRMRPSRKARLLRLASKKKQFSCALRRKSKIFTVIEYALIQIMPLTVGDREVRVSSVCLYEIAYEQ